MEVSTQMFRTWERDPVTVVMKRMLEVAIEDAKEYMANPDVIEQLDSRAKIHRMLGYTEGLKEALYIHITTEEELTNENGTNRV
tara:strand:+ start:94 stop:345 length:252 start_codon:yes stop_codon:yes gene_type:complete